MLRQNRQVVCIHPLQVELGPDSFGEEALARQTNLSWYCRRTQVSLALLRF
jgi:hypothetical protein